MLRRGGKRCYYVICWWYNAGSSNVFGFKSKWKEINERNQEDISELISVTTAENSSSTETIEENIDTQNPQEQQPIVSKENISIEEVNNDNNDNIPATSNNETETDIKEETIQEVPQTIQETSQTTDTLPSSNNSDENDFGL